MFRKGNGGGVIASFRPLCDKIFKLKLTNKLFLMYNCEAVKIDHCPMSKTMHCMKKIKKISVSEETFLKQIENLKKIFLKI